MDLPNFIRAERVRVYNKSAEGAKRGIGIYIMESSQRTLCNPALETAIFLSNLRKVPLLVCFKIKEELQIFNLRHFTFMLEGLKQVKNSLEERGIRFLLIKDDPMKIVEKLLSKLAFLVIDKGYLQHQRTWRNAIVNSFSLPIIEIEGDVVVPIETASKKAIPYARNLRPKLLHLLSHFLEDIPQLEPRINSLDLDLSQILNEIPLSNALDILPVDKSVAPSSYFKGGEEEAKRRLKLFIEQRLPLYSALRSDPGAKATSELSPYLRFGQISPVYIVREILKVTTIEDENVKSFINELVIWRELARNFVWFNRLYSKFEGLADWAKKSLEKHCSDSRPIIYSLDDLENANTHDPYWNAAQKELLWRGVIHNYIRMYWCKKLIEWTKSPRDAFEYACYLNNKYALDGIDPNSYSGIAWCFGSFDRPFPERPIYGKIRKMTEQSLLSKRYFQNYLSTINSIHQGT